MGLDTLTSASNPRVSTEIDKIWRVFSCSLFPEGAHVDATHQHIPKSLFSAKE